MLYYVSGIILKIVYFVLKPFKIRGKDKIPKVGEPLIVVANHIDEFDPWKIGSCLPLGMPIRWFAKRELYSIKDMHKEYCSAMNNWVLARVAAICTVFTVRFSLTIPVDREREKAKINRLAIKKALELLGRGKVIGIFGEGGMYREGKVRSIFVSLAAKTGAKILPVKIELGKITFGKAMVCENGCDAKRRASEIMNGIYRLSEA